MCLLEHYLYYVVTNSYTKFQVNISKEKSGKLKCGRQMDGQTVSKLVHLNTLSKRLELKHQTVNIKMLNFYKFQGTIK